MYAFEAKLTTDERNKLKTREFGLPDKRKYPLHDPEHVLQAIKFFNYCNKDDKAELAGNIIEAIERHGMKGEVNVSNKNAFYKYWVKYTAKDLKAAECAYVIF